MRQYLLSSEVMTALTPGSSQEGLCALIFHVPFCFCGPMCCVTSLSYLISVSRVSCHDFISNIKLCAAGKIPRNKKKKKKKGNDGFSCFLNARSLTTLLPTVCLCLPHWKEAFQPLIKWILSSWNGSMCVQNKWTHCILKGHSHTSVVMNSEWSWVGTWTCRWVWRLLWSHYKKASSIQDVCHAVKVKLFLVELVDILPGSIKVDYCSFLTVSKINVHVCCQYNHDTVCSSSCRVLLR